MALGHWKLMKDMKRVRSPMRWFVLWHKWKQDEITEDGSLYIITFS